MPNCLILGTVYPNSSAAPTVSDLINGTWPAVVVTANGGVGNAVAAIFIFPNTGAGQTVITEAFAAVINPFCYAVSEFSNIAASSAVEVSTGNPNVATSALTCGSFSPTAGNLIWAFFCQNGGPIHGNPTFWTKGSGFTMLDGDIAWTDNTGLAHATEYRLAPGGAINPGITTTGDTSANLYNCVAVALKASGGTPALIQHFASSANPITNGITGKTFKIPIRNPVGGVGYVAGSGKAYINKILHFTTDVPPTPTWKLQTPMVGTHGVLINGQSPGQINITAAVDSDSNTWAIEQNLSDEPQMIWAGNLSPNTDRFVNLTITGTPQTTSWRFYDISGLVTVSPKDATAFNDTVNSSGTTVTGCPVLNVPTAGDLVIGTINIGNGPGLSSTVTNATFDLCTYPPEEVDADQLENADGGFSLYNSPSGNLSCDYTITDHGSPQTIKGSAIAFKVAAATGGLGGATFFNRMGR